jgi:thiol-disulfide isomerase/thioredoxin
MKRFALIASIVTCIAAPDARTAFAAEKPADRVVAMYFHRTERCPTCQKVGSYAEEAVQKGFTQEVKKGTVEFHYVDFQDEKNAALTKGYKISGPALVIAQVRDHKVKQFKNLEEIWTKVQQKDQFLKYVRDNLEAYRK